jgi:hypothetical protein
MRVFVLLFAVLSSAAVAMGQGGACSEQNIRAIIAKGLTTANLTQDHYFFSGALDKPVIGEAARQQAGVPILAARKNESDSDKTERIVVAGSADMAYEYGTGNVSYDDVKTGKHVNFSAAYLRVWRVDGGVCKVAAEMYEPEEGNQSASDKGGAGRK